jgi:uncharacterized protein (TIGR00369 family)
MSEPEGDQGLHELAVGLLNAVPFASVLGISVSRIRRGEAILSLEVREEFKQNHGIVHGGVIASLIDTAAAIAVATVLGVGEASTTIDLTVHYLRPLRVGRVDAKASILREGRSVIVISVEVAQPPSPIVATGMTAFLRLKNDPV